MPGAAPPRQARSASMASAAGFGALLAGAGREARDRHGVSGMAGTLVSAAPPVKHC